MNPAIQPDYSTIPILISLIFKSNVKFKKMPMRGSIAYFSNG